MDTIFQIDSFDTFKVIVQEILSNLYYLNQSPSTKIELELLQKAKQDVKTILSDCDFDINKISELLNMRTWEKNKVNYFINLVETQKTEILCASLNHYTSVHGQTIEDFDWSLRYVLGTSELKTYNYPLLQLTLSVLNSSGEHKKIIYEFNKDMLSKIIDCLNNINIS